MYLLVDPGFYLPLLKFLWRIAIRSPRRMDAPDERTDGRRDAFFRPSVRLLDGVWHFGHVYTKSLYSMTVCMHDDYFETDDAWANEMLYVIIAATSALI